MSDKKPLQIKGITSLLEAMNLSKYQKHEHFHILKFEDHIEEMPKTAFFRSENYFEFTLSYNHNVEIEVDGKNVNNTDSNIFFLSPGHSIHIDVNEFEDDSFGFMLLFNTDFLNFASSNFNVIQQFPFFNMHLSPLYSLEQKHSLVLLQYMEKMYEEFQKLDKSNVEIIRSMLTIILFEAKRLLVNDTIKSITNSRAEEIAFNFENLLKVTEHKKQKLNYYASQLNISDIYLSECVKKATGKPAKKIITEYMIFEAKSLITQSSNTIDNIAFQVGFNDTSNFINFFKKNTNMTPNQFRNKK